MKRATQLEWLYLINATLLICHEIDSAYWHEWSLFHLPGGIQVFVLLHLLLLPMVLYGYREVCGNTARVRPASLLLAGVGVMAAMLHGAFILMGDPAFTLPLSQTVLGAILLVSLLQIAMVYRHA